MVTAGRWLLAAAVVPLVLAGCASSAGPPGAGTGPVGHQGASANDTPAGNREH